MATERKILWSTKYIDKTEKIDVFENRMLTTYQETKDVKRQHINKSMMDSAEYLEHYYYLDYIKTFW